MNNNRKQLIQVHLFKITAEGLTNNYENIKID